MNISETGHEAPESQPGQENQEGSSWEILMEEINGDFERTEAPSETERADMKAQLMENFSALLEFDTEELVTSDAETIEAALEASDDYEPLTASDRGLTYERREPGGGEEEDAVAEAGPGGGSGGNIDRTPPSPPPVEERTIGLREAAEASGELTPEVNVEELIAQLDAAVEASDDHQALTALDRGLTYARREGAEVETGITDTTDIAIADVEPLATEAEEPIAEARSAIDKERLRALAHLRATQMQLARRLAEGPDATQS